MQCRFYCLTISGTLPYLVSFSLLQAHTRAYTTETVSNPTLTHTSMHTLSLSDSEVKLFHLSGVLLSSYKASVRTAGRLIVTY